MGGRATDQSLNLQEHALADWEILADAVVSALSRHGLSSTDALRRAMEDMPESEYLSLSYYERWSRGAEQLLVEKSILTTDEIDRKMSELEATWGVS